MALEFEKKALDIQLVLFGENHPDVATSYNNIGFTYGELGDNQKKLEYEEKALKIRVSLFGSIHPDVADSYNSVGSTYKAFGQVETANEYFRKSAAIWKGLAERGNEPRYEEKAMNCLSQITEAK